MTTTEKALLLLLAEIVKDMCANGDSIYRYREDINKIDQIVSEIQKEQNLDAKHLQKAD